MTEKIFPWDVAPIERTYLAAAFTKSNCVQFGRFIQNKWVAEQTYPIKTPTCILTLPSSSWLVLAALLRVWISSKEGVAMDEKNKECKEYHVLALEKGLTILNSVYTRSGQNSTPNSNATNLHSSQKRCCSFCISSSNASPTFQVQKSIFHQMTKPIQVTVILPLLLAISFSRNDDIHSSISGISNDLIGVIPTIGQ